jgi:ABC-2 type transport system ATP-binding protein
MIEVENLTKKFGNLTAVDDLSFHVNEGEIFGFLGPNGAGKTTTVRMLSCLISKTSGSARVAGYDIGNDADSMKIRQIIGVVPDDLGLYEDLSAYENLDFYGKLYGCTEIQRKESIQRLLTMLGLWEKRDAASGTFSKGMKQKLAIARALIHDPKILFLDEPTANLDPISAKTVRDFILELKNERKTIFLNTHNLDEVQRICDRVAILKTRLIAVGTPNELKESLWLSKTVIQVDQVNDRILKALEELSLKKITTDKNRLIIDVTNLEKENPGIVDAIVRAGGRIQLVTDVSPTLEDVYLDKVGEIR